MSGKKKILKVLERIKCESEINHDPEWVEFIFNTSICGVGILSNDEERRILIKLEKECVIELHLPNGRNDQEEAILSGYTPIEYMLESDIIWIKILPSFYQKYFLYSLISLNENNWNLINPFWILWQIIKIIYRFINWFWSKYRIISLVIGIIGTPLIYDWALAWKNVKIILIFLKVI